jgi:hypothetical protein
MPDKYSLRVELPIELADKLRKISAKKAQNMTDWIRSQIVEAPEIESNIDDFRKQYPRLFSKLLFWTKKRVSVRGWGLFSESQKIDIENQAFEEVYSMISEIVFAENEQALKTKFDYFDKRLSHQEKACLAKFFPFLIHLKTDEKIDWFQKSNWYNLENGEYIVLKEKVTHGFNYKGDEAGLVTVNSYDANVLNASNMMIVDVDLVGESSLPTDPVITPYQSVALAALKAYQHEKPYLGFRVYKTAGGLRYICTTETFDPSAACSDRIMRQLFTDPKYRNLCKFQETYRARLTPKPWRAAGYEKDECKVCELIEIVGPEHIIDNFKDMVQYHDEQTLACADKDGVLVLA